MERIYVEKRRQFAIESRTLEAEIQTQFGKKTNVRIINIYEVDGLRKEQIQKVSANIFSEPNVDDVHKKVDLNDSKFFATEFLPAQFDARADSAKQCINLLFPEAVVNVFSSKLYIFDKDTSDELINEVKTIVINNVEMKEKNLGELGKKFIENNSGVEQVDNFIKFNKDELSNYYKQTSFAMNLEDLEHIQKYFKEENRNPYEAELLMLDTYWSDHCRHTTFETEIESIEIEESDLKEEIEKSLKQFEENRLKLCPHKVRNLMNLATINAREQVAKGKNKDVEISNEINACSVIANVDVDGKDREYLIQFKNETHNHPTEIEPFGGASTCLGGAIRDPLSGRAYVYQGMRVSGSGNPWEAIEDTLENKLPQRTITKVSALGFASYGNQIGMATTLVEEIIHPNFKAKHMEVGAVVAATPIENVKREEPIAGDLIIMLGGKTGRDGIGGATGSSKEHDEESVTSSASEVQKGNPPEERKLQRLFMKKEFASLIKKCNDFGAGGVSVAIGELADSIDVDLNAVPLKYIGLNGTDIALSESQERMAIVIDKKDLATIKKLAKEENTDAIHVATVTNSGRLIMRWNDKDVINIKREFIETNGVRQKTNAIIEKQNSYIREVPGNTFEEKFNNNIASENVASQKPLTQLFDSTIGTSTVLSPYGGKTGDTKVHASVQKVPMFNGSITDTATMLTSAYNPLVTSASPFLGGAYAIVAAISKIVSYGGNIESVKFSLQEYFEKLGNDPIKWGKPLAALLGASRAMREFDLSAIGGKDSMSGTYKDIDVPPTLIAFALSIVKASNVISSEFKKAGNNIYVLKHNPKSNGFPNFDELKTNYKNLEKLIVDKKVISAWPLVKGGIAEALFQMAIGNNLGFDVETTFDIFDFNYGTIVVESAQELDQKLFTKIGKVTDGKASINGNKINLEHATKEWKKPWNKLFAEHTNLDKKSFEFEGKNVDKSFAPDELKDAPNVLIPIFPGTNCEFDLERQFIRSGAKVKQFVFNNQDSKSINESIKVLASEIDKADIFVIAGGFSAGDEPDGSGKFIASILKNEIITKSIASLRNRKGLILGICNGFQALIKSGLLPYGQIQETKKDDPTLFKNDSNLHISKYIDTKVTSINSPWLKNFKLNEVHTIPVSHGEGKFVADDKSLEQLIKNNQIAFQYVDNDGKPTNDGRFNPNGSTFAIEGITSEDGLILGKMAHSERYEQNIAKNIYGNKEQNIFKNAIKYFKGEFK